MRHSYFGRKLSRSYDQRKGLLRELARSLVLRGSIKTTFAKAKAVQPMVERLITKAKIADDRAKRAVFQVLGDKETTDQLFAEASTRFNVRTSGYTRIVKLGPRAGDAAEEVLFSFVDARVAPLVVVPKSGAKATKEKKEAHSDKKQVKRSTPKKVAKPAKKTSAKRAKK